MAIPSTDTRITETVTATINPLITVIIHTPPITHTTIIMVAMKTMMATKEITA